MKKEGKREEYEEKCQWNLRKMKEGGGEENLAEKQEGETKTCRSKLKEKGLYFQFVPFEERKRRRQLGGERLTSQLPEMETRIYHLTKRVTNLGESAQEFSSDPGFRNNGDWTWEGNSWWLRVQTGKSHTR